MQGSNESRFYDYPNIPERYQSAIRSGINLFEMHFPKPSEWSQPIFGPYDIVVKEELIDGTTSTRYDAKVLTGSDAHIRYETVNKRGMSIAFMPDDKFWHNRVILCDNPFMHVVRLHTRDGIVSGTEIRSEIDCLREALNESIQMYKVVNQAGRIINEFKGDNAKENAEQFAKDNQEKDWVAVPTTYLKKKQSVIELIRKYKGLQYGWTSCLEFKERIVPDVEARIEKARRSLVLEGQVGANSGDLEGQVKSILKNLSVSELTNLLSAAKAKQATVQGPGVSYEDTGRFSRSGLDRKNIADLEKIAKVFGIELCEGKRKPEIIDSILTAQEKSFLAYQGEAIQDEEIIVT